MKKLIHYYHPVSRGMRTQKLLEIFEIPHEAVIVDYTKGEHRSEDYLKINPLGRVPALAHGDLLLTESGAITLYLADLFPEEFKTPQVGSDARGRLYEWLFFFQTTMEQTVLPVYSGGDKQEIAAKLRGHLEAMRTRFVGPYVLGEEFTLLDVTLHIELAWYKMMDVWPGDIEPYAAFVELTYPRMNWD